MSAPKILSTKNYRLFQKSRDNRPVDFKKHRKLLGSMKKYGFLKCFPIIVFKGHDATCVVKDGQHRLEFAETLGLPVYYVEEEVDFDVAEINCTSKVWQLRDYAMKFSANGLVAYQEGLEFADNYGLSVGTAFALLAGTTSFTNCRDSFSDGTFKIKDRSWATAVARLYGPMVAMAPVLRNTRFVEACMAVCRVKTFDSARLLGGAERRRDLLVSYSTKEAYLDMVEELYNFGRKQLVGLKSLAIMAMRDRNVIKTAKKKDKPGDGAAA